MHRLAELIRSERDTDGRRNDSVVFSSYSGAVCRRLRKLMRQTDHAALYRDAPHSGGPLHASGMSIIAASRATTELETYPIPLASALRYVPRANCALLLASLGRPMGLYYGTVETGMEGAVGLKRAPQTRYALASVKYRSVGETTINGLTETVCGQVP